MKTRVAATIVPDIDHAAHIPGAIELHDDGVYYICPCGCKAMAYLPFRPAPSPSWMWDGNRERLTLEPSVHHKLRQDDGTLGGTHWHGYLRAGTWESI